MRIWVELTSADELRFIEERHATCLEAGMNDSIPKPLHQRDLERVLRKLAA